MSGSRSRTVPEAAIEHEIYYKTPRGAEFALWQRETTVLGSEIDHLEAALAEKRARLERIDERFLAQDNATTTADDDEDELADASLNDKDKTQIVTLEKELRTLDLLTLRQDLRIDRLKEQQKNAFRLLQAIWSAIPHSLSLESAKAKKEKNEALKTQRSSMSPLYKVGCSVRNRALEHTLGSSGVATDENVIRRGNKAAHFGDVLADICLYVGEDLVRKDTAKFENFYGASFHLVQKYRGLEQFVQVLNWGFDLKMMAQQRGFDVEGKVEGMKAFREYAAGFVKEVRKRGEEVRGELEKGGNGRLGRDFARMKEIHGTAVTAYQAWWKGTRRSGSSGEGTNRRD